MKNRWLTSTSLVSIPISLSAAVLLVSCSSSDSFSGSNTLTTTAGLTIKWAPPTEREDGTPLDMAEISGYRIYYGTTTGDYPNQVDINDSTVVETVIEDIPSGTYFVVATTIDIDGRESVYSTEFQIQI